MTSKDDVKRLAAEVRQREGGLHLLVNNAGIAGPKTKVSKDDDSVETWSQKLLEEPVEGWDDVFRTNVTNIFLMTSAFLPLLAKFTYGGDAAGRAIYEKYQTGVCVLLPCFFCRRSAFGRPTVQPQKRVADWHPSLQHQHCLDLGSHQALAVALCLVRNSSGLQCAEQRLTKTDTAATRRRPRPPTSLA